MATASSTSKRLAPPHIKTVAELQQQLPPARPRGRRRTLLVAAVSVALLGWFAPWIAAHSPAVQAWAIHKATKKLNGTVTVGWMSLGWLSPIQAGDIEVRDADGSLVLAIPRVQLDKSLGALALSHADLGRIEVDQPELHLTIRSDGSNLETLLQKVLAEPPHPSTNKTPAFSVEVNDGKVALDDGAAAPSQFDGIALKLTCSAGHSLPDDIEFTGKTTVGASTGEFTARLEAGSEERNQQLTLRSQLLPLAALQPLVARLLPGVQLGGRLNCDLAGQFKNGASFDQIQASLAGKLATDDLMLGGFGAPGEQIRIAKMQIPISADWRNQRLDLQDLSVDCDFGQLRLQAGLPTTDFTGSTNPRAWIQQTFAVQGNLDLARLAQAIPQTLHLRPGLQITSGSVTLSLDSRDAANGHHWQANIATTALTANDNGRAITWDSPLTMAVAAHQEANGVTIDNCHCDSSFLHVQAAGTPDQIDAAANCDLDQLAGELGRFVDLGNWKLAGTATAALKWRRAANDQFNADASLQLKKLQCTMPGRLPWSEEGLDLTCSANGLLSGTRLARCDQMTFDLRAGGDRAWLQLTQPVSVDASAVWPLKAGIQGSLASWAPRLQPWCNLSRWSLGGTLDAAVSVSYGAAGLDLPAAQLTVSQLHAWGPGVFVDDPSLLVQTSAHWDRSGGKFALGKTIVNCSAVNFEADDLSLALADAARPRVQGTLRFAADPDRLYLWTCDPRQQAAWRMVGKLTGQIAVDSQASNVSAQLDGEIAQFGLYNGAAVAAAHGGPVQPVWQEAKVALAAAGSYDAASDAAQLTSVQLTAAALRLIVGGKLEKLSTTMDLNLDGQLDYDLPTISQLLRPYWGANIAFTGRESRKFFVRGPLVSATVSTGPAGQAPASLAWLQPLSAEGSLGWEGATIYGLKIGAGQVDAALGQGALTMKPLDFAIGEGRLTLAPTFRLAPDPAAMQLPKGPLLSNMRLTPEICATGLKFVAPSLADSTRADGLFSVTLSGGHLPLGDPGGGDVSGQLLVQSVEVLPGPTANVMVALARQIETIFRQASSTGADDKAILRMPNQAIDFKLVDRRVYHQNLEMQAGNVTIRTHGSVGLDETISMVAEIPIRSEWAKNAPGAKDKIISVLIDGTLKKPHLDPRAVEKLAAALIGNAIENTVGKQLDKLLGPR